MQIRKNYIDELDEEDIPKSVSKMRKNKHAAEKPSKSPTKKKSKKKKKNKKTDETIGKTRLKKAIKYIVIILLIIFLINLLITTIRWRKMAKDMLNSKCSIVVDMEGKEIARIGENKIKTTVSSSEIPDKLKKAYVAIEDERFYSHHGVDGKRTVAAIGSYVVHFGSSSFGGSTITQQLVKNMTGDSSNKATRKVKEWWKAWNLESLSDKDEIITCYLNTIYVGPNIYGVEAGSHYYFSKSAKDLSIAEEAFLAGINHSPNSYNPFTSDNSEKIKQRTKTVLKKMKDLDFISNDEYKTAIEELENGLAFKNEELEPENGVYSYHTDALINEVIKDISKKYKISPTFAENYLELAGAKIYSTQDSGIQASMEEEFAKEKYQMESNIGNNPSQAAMVIIDHETGEVLGCVGGLGEKTEARPLNRAVQSIRQTGSSIKPIAVVAPAIEEKLITASTIVDDTERDFEKGYHPIDYTSPLGNITVRRAIESSQNVPFVEIMETLTPKKSIKYLEKMGITTLTEDDETLILALGGLKRGISPLEMASAYATIANNGVYIEPTFYTEVKRPNGKKLVKTKQKTKKVFSRETAYIMQEILTQPIQGEHGTAKYCGIEGIDVAAKTGTTDDNYDRWLCGFSPYYTCVCWYGYDICESIDYNGRNPSGLLWANVMSNIHIGLSGRNFIKAEDIVEITICAESGSKAKTGCEQTYTEYFIKGTEPGGCPIHDGTELTTVIKDEPYSSNKIEAPKNEIVAPVEETRQNQNTNTNTNKPTNDVYVVPSETPIVPTEQPSQPVETPIETPPENTSQEPENTETE